MVAPCMVTLAQEGQQAAHFDLFQDGHNQLQLCYPDGVDHPAKKAKNCGNIYGGPVLDLTSIPGFTFQPATSSIDTQSGDSSSSTSTETTLCTEDGVPGIPKHSQSTTAAVSAQKVESETKPREIPIPPILAPKVDAVELAGSLDGWLRQSLNLPSLKIRKQCDSSGSDASTSTENSVMHSGFGSPIPGSPQWFRLQPSPGCPSSRASPSPSIEIEVLSPVVPEAYPEATADIFPDADDLSHSPMAWSPLCGFGRPGSPLSAPRRRRLSRLSCSVSPLKESPMAQNNGNYTPQQVEPLRAAAAAKDGNLQSRTGASPADNDRQSIVSTGSENSADSQVQGYVAVEMQALEIRFVQLLQAAGGCLPVAMALPLFRDYMFDDRGKDTVRGMLSRWCTVRDGPDGGRWLLLRSALEQQQENLETPVSG